MNAFLEKPIDNGFGANMFLQMQNVFLNPELQRRKEAGQLPEGFSLEKFQIMFSPLCQGRPEVRLNNEVDGQFEAALKIGILKKPYDPVSEADIEKITRFILPEKDMDFGHVTGIRLGLCWNLFFDARRNRGFAKRNLENVRQSLEAAEFSFEKGNLNACVSNLYDAAELAVKAELLMFPEPKFLSPNLRHGFISNFYSRWAGWGNDPLGFKDTYKKLANMRNKARYLTPNNQEGFEKEKITEILGKVKEMAEYVKLQIGN